MIYDKNQWVSYLSKDEYSSRVSKWQGMQFGGISDWAADLDADYGSSGTGVKDDGDVSDDNGPFCPWNNSFESLDALSKAAPGLPMLCVQWFALKVMLKMVGDAQTKFKDVNNGYDDKFNAYIRYIKQMIPDGIETFMRYNATSKTWYGNMGCKCGLRCLSLSRPEQCVLIDLVLDFNCDYDAKSEKRRSLSCDKLTKRDLDDGIYDLYLHPKNLDTFHSALANTTGISPDWVDLDGFWSTTDDCGINCVPTSGSRQWYNYPEMNKTLVVPNPKDIITKTIGSFDSLREAIFTGMSTIQAGVWDGDADDIVQTVSVPVFLLVQALESMESVKKLGEEEEKKEKEKKKSFIISIVGIALIFIPFIGDAAAVIQGAAMIARIFSLAADGAGIGLGIYEFSHDPKSGFMGLIGALFGLRGVAQATRDAAGFAKLAVEARALRELGVMAKLGGSIKTNDAILQAMTGVCRR